jgi:hypothetical protein
MSYGDSGRKNGEMDMESIVAVFSLCLQMEIDEQYSHNTRNIFTVDVSTLSLAPADQFLILHFAALGL